MCSTGRRQSPINIEPQNLLFDPHLQPLQVGKHRVGGVLHNTGQGVVFRLNIEEPNDFNEQLLTSSGVNKQERVNISGGPLSYSYRVYEVQLHFGRSDRSGSEHLLAGFAFPAEVRIGACFQSIQFECSYKARKKIPVKEINESFVIPAQVQIYGYNSELYANASQARSRAHGIAVVSTFVKVTPPKTSESGRTTRDKMTKPNLELKMLTDQLQHIIYKGDSVTLKSLSIQELLPSTSALMTYEGSLTSPGCEETATWIIVNRPLYVSSQQVSPQLEDGLANTLVTELG